MVNHEISSRLLQVVDDVFGRAQEIVTSTSFRPADAVFGAMFFYDTMRLISGKPMFLSLQEAIQGIKDSSMCSLAARSGLQESVVSRILSGATVNSRPDVLNKIAQGAGASIFQAVTIFNATCHSPEFLLRTFNGTDNDIRIQTLAGLKSSARCILNLLDTPAIIPNQELVWATAILAYDADRLRGRFRRQPFPGFLNECMGRGGVSTSALAERVGVDRTYISHLKNGTRDPSLEVLLSLIKDLKPDPDAAVGLMHTCGFNPHPLPNLPTSQSTHSLK